MKDNSTEAEYIPHRGDIVWLDYDPSLGREILKRRPALVVSPLSYNKAFKLALFMPITSKVKGYPFELELGRGLKKVEGCVLCDQLNSLDWGKRNAVFIEKAPEQVVRDALEMFSILLQRHYKKDSKN